MRAGMTVVLTVALWATAVTAAQAATITVTGSLAVTSVSSTSPQRVSGTATVNYSCVPTTEYDYCSTTWFATIGTVPAGQPCQDGFTWVGPIESSATKTFDVGWREYDPGPASKTACLYVYAGGDRFVAQASYEVPPLQCPGDYAIKAGGDRIATSRWMPITVSEGSASAGAKQVRLEMKVSATGRVFYSHDFTKRQISDLTIDDALFYMQLDRGDGPSFAQLTWTGSDGCTGSARTGDVRRVKGAKGRVRRVGAMPGRPDDAGLRFGPRPGRSCLLTALRKLRVKVTSAGRSKTFRLNGWCGRWNKSGARMRHVRVRLFEAGDLNGPAWLSLAPRPPAGENGKRVTVSVYEGRRRVLRQAFESVWDRVPDRKVWEGTDAFWNYCINGLKTTYSQGGRLYCIDPGTTIKYVRLD